MSRSSGQGVAERRQGLGRHAAATPVRAAIAPLPDPVPWEEEAHETSGMTSRLVLDYVERRGGRSAVQQLLARCGLEEVEDDLRDESHWFSFATKIRLFQAASEVLDDPSLPRHMGQEAIELNVGETLKLALRALGSPRLVYENVVRASGKFSTTARMDLLDLGHSHARVAYVDVTGTPFHPLDCQYNQGLLSCVPTLFGLPLARVSHPICAGDGGEACIYDLSWESGGAYVRFALTSLLGGAAALGAAALFEPALVPEAGILAATLGGVAARRTFAARRRRLRRLEAEVREQSEVAQKLAGSLQDIASELRLEDVLAKVTLNAKSTLPGKQFALLVRDGGELHCRGSSGLPEESIRALEGWAAATRRLEDTPLLLEDLSAVPSLAGLPLEDHLPLRSLCAAPLNYRGESLGVLAALSASPRTFLPRDVDVVQSYATQAAIALTNARLYEAQQELASRDPLTGLLNHREFHESVGRELERCRRYGGRLSVALFDLDGFKAVNDVAGHAEGDRMLRATAEALSESCRSSDVAFRIGGDEFALLLPETAPAEALAVAERAAEAVGALSGRLDVSFGIGVWPDEGPSKDALLARADENLYSMKRDRERVRRPGRANCGQPSHSAPGRGERARLALASSLSARLAPLLDAEPIARVTVEGLQASYGCQLAAIHRLDPDGKLWPVAGAGPLVREISELDERAQSLHDRVIGRVARTGEPALPGSGSELAVPVRVAGHIWGVLELESLESGAFGEDDLLLADMVAAQVGGALHRGQLFEELESTFTTTLGVLSDALEAKDSYAAAHADDVAGMAVRVGRRLGLTEPELRILRYGALLHDIGKIGVRSEVLKKPGRLTAEEFEEIKKHTAIGAKMLERIPFFAPVQPLVRSTHERWDGRGYPDGLAGDEIPLGARVISTCDAFHAMISYRPYGEVLSVEEALEELRRCAGSQFDPAVVEALVADVEENGVDA